MRVCIILVIGLVATACAKDDSPTSSVTPVAHASVARPVPSQPPSRPAKADAKAEVVAASVLGYEKATNRTCPCPYSKGGECQGQSAYERSGGADPRCYKTDVTDEDERRWRELLKMAPAASPR